MKVGRSWEHSNPSHSHHTASPSFRAQLKIWYLKAERAQQTMHIQLLHCPSRSVLNTETLEATLTRIAHSDQPASRQTMPPLNELSSQWVNEMEARTTELKQPCPCCSQCRRNEIYNSCMLVGSYKHCQGKAGLLFCESLCTMKHMLKRCTDARHVHCT